MFKSPSIRMFLLPFYSKSLFILFCIFHFVILFILYIYILLTKVFRAKDIDSIVSSTNIVLAPCNSTWNSQRFSYDQNHFIRYKRERGRVEGVEGVERGERGERRERGERGEE